MTLTYFSKRASDYIDIADSLGNIKNNRSVLNYVRMCDSAYKEADITEGVCYPFAGDNTGDQSQSFKYNLLNPTQYTLSFLGGGWLFSNTGAKPNGTTSYADTFFSSILLSNKNSNHISIFTQGSISGNRIDIGMYGTISGIPKPLWLSAGRSTSSRYEANYGVDGISVNGNGFTLGSYTQDSIYILKNSFIEKSVPSVGGYPVFPDFTMYIGAINNNGSPFYFSNREIRFASIGNGFSSEKALAFSHNISVAQKVIGREI